MKADTVAQMLLNKINEIILNYDNQFSPNHFIFKLYFNELPSLISLDNNILKLYNKAILKVVDYSAEREKLTTLIKNSQKQLDALREKGAESFAKLEEELKAIYPKVGEFTKQVKIEIKNAMKDYSEKSKGGLTIDTMDKMANHLYKAFYTTMLENGS
jgi:hypothetical protein